MSVMLFPNTMTLATECAAALFAPVVVQADVAPHVTVDDLRGFNIRGGWVDVQEASVQVDGSIHIWGGKETVAKQIAYGTMRAEIDAWTRLPADWDGNDGEPISDAVAFSAIEILDTLSLSAITPPEVYVAGDGEVGFQWKSARGYASVSLLDDGHLVALVDPVTGEGFRIDAPAGQVSVDDLIASLRAVA